MPDKIVARGTGGGHFTPSPKPSNAKQAFSSGPRIDGLDDAESAVGVPVGSSAGAEQTATSAVAPSLPPDELSALESKAEADSLGDLHARRRQLMVSLAPLRALYGSFGLWDARRKRLLESLKIRARMELIGDNKPKPTEAQIDATAHADEQYARFLDDALTAKIEYLNLETEASELEERIRNREIVLRAYTAEARL